MTYDDETDERRFAEFHTEHPEVWSLFVYFAFEKIRAGFQHYSSHAILNRIRWETEAPTSWHGKDFKIPNLLEPYYPRLFAQVYPEHADFFRFRTSQADGSEYVRRTAAVLRRAAKPPQDDAAGPTL